VSTAGATGEVILDIPFFNALDEAVLAVKII